MIFLKNLRMLLLAAWFGAAIYFSAVVAPSAFGVLRSAGVPNPGEVAGAIVSRTLSVVNVSGCVVGLLLLLTVFLFKKTPTRWSFVIQVILLVIVTAATAIGEWVIAAKMRGLRLAMHGQIDQVPLSDPNRVAFAALHGYSVAALGLAMMAALIALLLMARQDKLQ